MAARLGDASAGPELLAMFEEAIRAEPSNPAPYINKAAFLLQVSRLLTVCGWDWVGMWLCSLCRGTTGAGHAPSTCLLPLGTLAADLSASRKMRALPLNTVRSMSFRRCPSTHSAQSEELLAVAEEDVPSSPWGVISSQCTA